MGGGERRKERGKQNYDNRSKTENIIVMCAFLARRGCGLVGRAPEFRSEDPGFDLLSGQGERHFFFYPSESIIV